MKTPSLSRFFTLLLAATVALVTLAVTAHAAQTITTPNEVVLNYDLAPGANSAAVTPAANVPVFVQGVQTTLGFRGVGHVSMLRVPSSFLEWTGIESPSAAAITSGFSGTAGTHIVYLDFSHLVDIQVNTTDTFHVHNANSETQTGQVTLIW
jgi:hypothetical protein